MIPMSKRLLTRSSRAYMTVSGPDGGLVYEFKALAAGIRHSNGG
jgi:lactonase